MNKPIIKNYFLVEMLEPDTVFLVSETAYRIFTGKIYKQLLPLLNGANSPTDMIQQLEGVVSPMEVYYALNQLQAQGCLTEATERIPPAQSAYWELFGGTAVAAAEKLQQTAVAITTLGPINPQPFAQALKTVEINTLPAGQPASLQLVITDDYLRDEISAINQQALQNKQPWLLAKPVGNLLWIGPLFLPGQTACWACLSNRIHANRQVESYILKKLNRTEPFPTSISALPSAIAMSANLIATEVAKWVTQGKNQQLYNQLITFDLLTSQTQSHYLVQQPQCPACGQPALFAQTAKPIELQSYKKKFMGDGGHRAFFPEETFAKYKHHISPITGVVSQLTNMIQDNNGIAYSYNASHNFAMISDDMSILHHNLRARSGGKGMSDIQAKVSAIAEAMERFSGVYRGDIEVRKRGTYRQLQAEAIHLDDVLRISPKQYAEREEWNKNCSLNFHLIPNVFDEEKELDWTPLWSLTRQEFRYLPTAYCYYGHPELRYFFSASDANGCAAGNRIEEAILQGFLELTERDAVAMWWYNRLKRPLVDVDSFGIPYYQTLQTYYQKHHRQLWVLDLTNDLGIPTFAAVSNRIDKPQEDVIVGFGSHFDPKIAILRSLTEVNQVLPSVSYSDKNGNALYFVDDKDTLDWFMNARVEKETYLAPDKTVPSKTVHDYTPLFTDDLLEDVHQCVRIAEKAGLEMFVLDQTRPDVGLKVCRVVVPGLRHFWRRLGSGRLYDVPVQLGWLDKPKTEEELNPYSLFF